MSILSLLKKIQVRIDRNNDSVFSIPAGKQKKFLESIKEPSDDLERSFAQYKCQMKLYGGIKKAFMNIAALPMIIYYLRSCGEVECDRKTDAVFFKYGLPENIIPVELKDAYREWVIVTENREYLSKEGKHFFGRVRKKYPFSFLLQLKILIKIRLYDYEIKTHNPKAIVVCSEYSFTSSAMTAYCNSRGIEHIDCMHGEKLFFIRDSFFRFDRCFVWDVYYKNLFKELRAEPDQFTVAVPPSLKFITGAEAETVDYTYYLGREENDQLCRVIQSMVKLCEKGSRVAIRPHPRYTNIQELKKDVSDTDIEIEDCGSLSIEKSVLRTKHVVSVYSTVLNQAYHNGVPIVIDDITNPEHYGKLKTLKYIMFNKEHGLLSSVLGGTG